jgi:DNA-binding MarR family transcriptional regulator
MQAQLMRLHSSVSPATLTAMKSTAAASRAGAAPERLVGEWRELLERHAAVSCALERALEQHQIGLSEFETLDRLVDANCGQYRMSDLAGDIHLSQSALSRAVARLERDGLVERNMCLDDRRAMYVCLTEKGRRLHEEALPTHRAVLSETWAAGRHSS